MVQPTSDPRPGSTPDDSLGRRMRERLMHEGTARTLGRALRAVARRLVRHGGNVYSGTYLPNVELPVVEARIPTTFRLADPRDLGELASRLPREQLLAECRGREPG